MYYRAMEGLRGPARSGYTVTTTPLPPGDAGVRRTVANMRRLVDEGSRTLEVRQAAIGAIQMAGVGGHDVIGQVYAVFRFVRDRITFVNDPDGTEWLQTPRYTLQVAGGDCDDRATLLAAMLRTIGVPTDFKVVALDRRRPGSFSHVYAVAKLGRGRDIPLDPTYPENTLGSEPPGPTRTWTVSTWP
jgi:transglutaminase-like putative cysteine protease